MGLIAEHYKFYTDKEMELCTGKDPLMLAVPFKQMITEPADVMEKIYSHRCKVWGTPPEQYKGSKHEEMVGIEAKDPQLLEEKAWRKGMKKTYPTMKKDEIVALL